MIVNGSPTEEREDSHRPLQAGHVLPLLRIALATTIAEVHEKHEQRYKKP